MKATLARLSDGTEKEKEEAAEELVTFGKAAVPALEEILTGGTADPDARWWAVRALAEIPGRLASHLLIQALSDPDEDIQVCAVLALGERREKRAVRPLVGLLPDASGYLSRHISDALSKIGEPAVPQLMVLLSHETAAVRALAARALVPIESQDAIPALIQALDDPEPTVEHYAWEALQRMGVGVTYFFKP